MTGIGRRETLGWTLRQRDPLCNFKSTIILKEILFPYFYKPPCAGRFAKITTFVGVTSSLGRNGPWKSASPLASSPTQHSSTAIFNPPAPPGMSDDKKRDYAIELGDKAPNGTFQAESRPPPSTMHQQSATMKSVVDNPLISILTYCGSSILMTVANKYVVSGTNFNLNFFLLFVQVCIGDGEHICIIGFNADVQRSPSSV